MNKNSLGMSKDQMDNSYPDQDTKESREFVREKINKHLHWFNRKGYCNICSEKNIPDSVDGSLVSNS